MEAAIDMLEAKKAESSLNHLTRKLELRCQDHAQGNVSQNPLELLRKVKYVKEEYKALVAEAAEIEKAQAEAMAYFQTQLPIAMQALQQLQQAVGIRGTEEQMAKVTELQELLGIKHTPELVDQEERMQKPNDTHLLQQEKNDVCKSTKESKSAEVTHTKEPHALLSAGLLEDPVASRAALRAQSTDFVEVTQEEFMSVSELVRGRLKLSEVNSVYRSLYRYFKEEENSKPLMPADMYKMGIHVTGASGKAKLKVLRALKLLTISSKEEVKLV